MLSRVTQTVETRETAAPATAGELLDLVRTGRASTRSQLRLLTGLSRTAVTARVTALTSAGLLRLGEELASTGGRPPGALVFNQDAGVVLAVADRPLAQPARRARPRRPGARLRLARPRGRGRPGRAAARRRRAARRAARRRRTPPVLGIGLSLPGTLDRGPRAQHRLPGDDRLGRRRAGAVLRGPRRRPALRRERRRRARPLRAARRRRAASTTCWS